MFKNIGQALFANIQPVPRSFNQLHYYCNAILYDDAYLNTELEDVNRPTPRLRTDETVPIPVEEPLHRHLQGELIKYNITKTTLTNKQKIALLHCLKDHQSSFIV